MTLSENPFSLSQTPSPLRHLGYELTIRVIDRAIQVTDLAVQVTEVAILVSRRLSIAGALFLVVSLSSSQIHKMEREVLDLRIKRCLGAVKISTFTFFKEDLALRHSTRSSNSAIRSRKTYGNRSLYIYIYVCSCIVLISWDLSEFLIWVFYKYAQPSHKAFVIKKKVTKKMRQNRPIPHLIRLRTDNIIRVGESNGWTSRGLVDYND